MRGHRLSERKPVFQLLREVKFTAIRGNISEIKTVALGSGTTKGVDADIADRGNSADPA